MIDVQPVRMFLSPQHRELAPRLRRFVREHIATRPLSIDDDEARREARELPGLLGRGGWTMYAVTAPAGGENEVLDLRACCMIREALAGYSPLADEIFALQCLGSLPIGLTEQDDLKGRWLPKVASGSCMAGFAMTEPAAGSNVAALETTAVRNGGDYVLNGRKTLISNAGLADFYTVFARTGPDGGRDGLSAFLVPADTPGLVFAGAQVMSAPHPLGELELVDCRVPARLRLGDEGEGFKLGMRTLDRLRATVAASACGMAARAIELALEHARKREVFGKNLSDFQITRQKLAVMATELDAARLLTYRAAWEADRDADRVTVPSAMAKWYATEASQRIVDQAIQIIGGKGVLANHPVDHLYRAVRALRIYEGTTEIQQLVIARHMLRKG